MDRYTEKLITAFNRFIVKINDLNEQTNNNEELKNGWYAAFDQQTGYTASSIDGVLTIKVPVADAAFIQEYILHEQPNCNYNKYTISDCGQFVFYSFRIPNP